MCKVYRATGYMKGIVVDPGETELADPRYFPKDEICHYCKEKGHLRNDCPKLAQKQNEKMCEYLGCTMKVGHTIDKCLGNPRMRRIDLRIGCPVSRKIQIKQVRSETFLSTIQVKQW